VRAEYNLAGRRLDGRP
jgi:hypothetical protein